MKSPKLKSGFKIILITTWSLWLFTWAFAQPSFHLRITPSPGEASGTVAFYSALWSPTNSSNGLQFATILVGTTNVAIPPGVPSPSLLLVLAVGTNGVRSTNLNWTLYDTNVLWPTITNSIQPPPPPAGSFVITNS